MGLPEIFWIQAWSGAPLYLLACVAQGLWLHQRTRLDLAPLLAIGAFSTLLALLAGVVIWGRFFAGTSIMLWQAVNLPALLACIIIFPIVTLLLQLGSSQRS